MNRSTAENLLSSSVKTIIGSLTFPSPFAVRGKHRNAIVSIFRQTGQIGLSDRRNQYYQLWSFVR